MVTERVGGRRKRVSEFELTGPFMSVVDSAQEMLGLDADWAVKAVQAGGNYGELFEKNIGENSPVGLARGLNAQWTDGGLLYSPPFR